MTEHIKRFEIGHASFSEHKSAGGVGLLFDFDAALAGFVYNFL